MAQAKTITFGKAYVLLEEQDTGGGTGTFIAPCGFESLAMVINIESNTSNIPDCDNPDLPAWLATDIVSQQMTVQGNGVLDTDAMQQWQDWWYNDAGSERQIRFYRNLTAANGGGYFVGPAVMTAYEETGERGNRWQLATTLAFNGKPTWVPAVA